MMLCAFWLSACAEPSPSVGVTPTPPAVALPPALSQAAVDAAPALLMLERNGAAARDLPLLTALWAPDAAVIDGRNTKAPDDDYTWRGRTAILDRYVLAVFPVPPPPLETPPQPVLLEEDGDQAVFQNGGDRWTLRRMDERWYLARLVYQQP